MCFVNQTFTYLFELYNRFTILLTTVRTGGNFELNPIHHILFQKDIVVIELSGQYVLKD